MQLQDFINFRNNKCLCGKELQISISASALAGDSSRPFNIITSNSMKVYNNVAICPFLITRIGNPEQTIFTIKIDLQNGQLSYEFGKTDFSKIDETFDNMKLVFSDDAQSKVSLSLYRDCGNIFARNEQCEYSYQSRSDTLFLDLDNNTSKINKIIDSEFFSLDKGKYEFSFINDKLEITQITSNKKSGWNDYTPILTLDDKTFFSLPYDEKQLLNKINRLLPFT